MSEVPEGFHEEARRTCMDLLRLTRESQDALLDFRREGRRVMDAAQASTGDVPRFSVREFEHGLDRAAAALVLARGAAAASCEWLDRAGTRRPTGYGCFMGGVGPGSGSGFSLVPNLTTNLSNACALVHADLTLETHPDSFFAVKFVAEEVVGDAPETIELEGGYVLEDEAVPMDLTDLESFRDRLVGTLGRVRTALAEACACRA